MKITRFNLSNLFNEEWCTYENFLVKIMEPETEGNTVLASLLPMLKTNALAAAEAIEIIRKSEYTRLCDEMDTKRDRIIAGINLFVRSFVHDENSIVNAAAQNLMMVMDHYSGMAEENRDQGSSHIINFLSEMRDNHAAHIGQLQGLTPVWKILRTPTAGISSCRTAAPLTMPAKPPCA